MKKIAIIGGGNLGCAIALGLHQSGKVTSENIIITRNRVERLSHLKKQGFVISQDNKIAAQQADIIILALKPFKIEEVLNDIAPCLNSQQILISVATGISMQQLATAANQELPIFRAMPNTAIEIQESVTCICSAFASEPQQQEVVDLFNSLGQAILIKEELMDAATVLGACGIAYVFRFIRAMMQGGIEIGFDAQTASIIAEQTVKGAAELLLQGGKHPEEEIDKVTTPKGCTITGLNEMEHRGFSSSLIKGILSSFDKINP